MGFLSFGNTAVREDGPIRHDFGAVDDPLADVSASWLGRLQTCAMQLKEIAVSTEDEFLDIGARLHDFYQRAGEVSAIAGEMLARIRGEETDAGIRGLKEIIDRMESYLHHSGQEGEESLKGLETILSRLDGISGALSGFRKMNKTLRMLGISTKIESSRLGEMAIGFNTLAEEVTRLSNQVSDKAGAIIQQKDELGGEIRKTLANLKTIEEEQHAKVMAILGKTRQSLITLTGIVGRCSDSAGVITAATAEVADSMGQVVMSMQAHDSVRQQMEHVVEALEGICARLSSRPNNPAGGADPAADAGPLCELQSAQLRHAADEMLTAIDVIIENLRGITVTEAHISEDTRALAGVADQAGTSFFSEMGSDLSLVAGMLSDSAAANRKLTTMMVTVAETVREIFRFVEDIETIGEEIELIALNAQIQAACTGSEGAALGVLAEAIQRLSVDAREQTLDVASTLENIRNMTDGICSGLGTEGASLDLEVNEMLAGLSGLLQMLQQVNDSMLGSLFRTNELVNALSDDIINATSGISVHLRIAGMLEEIGTLDGVVAEARELVPSADWAGAAERLHELAQRYTMHSERRIHAHVTRADAPAVAGAGNAFVAGAAAAEDDDGLGDNVELF